MVPVYPGEGAAVTLCFLVFLLVNAGIIFGRNSSYSLFLVYFGVRYLPYMYFANAGFVILCSLVYTTLVDRFERGRFLAAISAIFVVILVASRIILIGRPHWFFPVLFMEAQVIWYFTLMQFWTFVGDLFDARQSKRLFPLLAIGGPVGMIAVWAVNGALVRRFGAESLLLMWAGTIVAGTALAGVAYRRFRIPPSPVPADAATLLREARPSEWEKIKGGLSEVGREPLLRSTAGYILFLWTVYAIVDFCFNKTMQQRYPHPAELATFFGFFFGLQGVVCVVIQSLLTRPVIARLGVGTTINFHPSFLIAGTGWMSMRYGYAPVFTTKLGDASMLYTFSDSSYQLLYNPIPPERRARVRGFIEGYIRPLSLAAAGLLVLLGNNYLKPLRLFGRVIPSEQQLAWGAFAVACVWLGFALSAKKGYVSALLGNLRGPNLSLREAAAKTLGELKDPASIAYLVGTLKSEEPGRIIAAIGLLESFKSKQAADAVACLLAHPDRHVRATAAGALRRLGAAPFRDRLAALLKDPDPRVRANAAEALSAAPDPSLAPALRPLLDDAFTRPRVNALLALAAVEGSSAGGDFLPIISKLVQGGREERVAAVYALARVGGGDSAVMLAKLLGDPELDVRTRAAKALGKIGGADAIPALIEALSGPAELRHTVRRAIASIARKAGQETVRMLTVRALEERRVENRSELADVLGRLDDPQVAGPLIHLLHDPEWRVEWKVLKAFGRLAGTVPLPENARAALFDYARRELGAYRESAACSLALVQNPSLEADRLLAQALEDDRNRIEERVFRMLGILAGHERMKAIHRNLRSPDPRQRADALEALDTLAPKPVGGEVLAMLEKTPRSSPEMASPDASAALESLARHPKPWIRACTAYFVGAHPNGVGESLLESLLKDPEPIVRETALYAGWLAFRQAWLPQAESGGRSNDPRMAECAGRIFRENAAGAPAGSAQARLKKRRNMLAIEKVLLLKNAPLFSALDSEELAALAEITLQKEYQPGETLFEQGETAHHLYVLVEGEVEVRRKVDSQERTVSKMGGNEVFGEMSLLDDEPRSATIRALGPTAVLKVDRENFRELIQERPQIALAILKILSLRLRHFNAEFESPVAAQPLHSMA